MKKRILAFAMTILMCLLSPIMAYASDIELSDEEEGIVTQEVEVNNDGYAIIEISAPFTESNIVPLGGGSETWNKDAATVGTFTMTGNNLTPVKTVGKPYEILMVNAKYSASKPVILTVQIRRAYTSTVLGQAKSSAASSGKVTAMYGSSQGDKIQIYFRVTDKNGKYDDNLACKITYGYQYTGRD